MLRLFRNTQPSKPRYFGKRFCTKYFKIMRLDKNNKNQYMPGLNIYNGVFNDDPKVPCNGIYFADKNHIMLDAGWHTHICDVLIPSDPEFKMINVYGGLYRANMIVLANSYDLSKIETVEYLHSVGVDLYNLHPSGDFLLDNVAQGNTNVVKFLVENIPCIDGKKINWAVYMYNDLVGDLHDIMCVDAALIYAAQYNRLEIAKILVDNGANICGEVGFSGEVGSRGEVESPLAYAIHYNSFDVAKFLLENGAGNHICLDRYLQYAQQNQDVEMIKLLTEYMDNNQ